MKFLEKQMTFNQVQEFLKVNKKYVLTKDIDEVFNNKCTPQSKYAFYNPNRGTLSSLIKQKVSVEYSDLYMLEMYKYIAKFGNNVGLKLDRLELTGESVKYYSESGLDMESLQEWTKRFYLEANYVDKIEEYLYMQPDRCIWAQDQWVIGVPESKYLSHTEEKIITKNKAILVLLEVGLSPRKINCFAGEKVITEGYKK